MNIATWAYKVCSRAMTDVMMGDARPRGFCMVDSKSQTFRSLRICRVARVVCARGQSYLSHTLTFACSVSLTGRGRGHGKQDTRRSNWVIARLCERVVSPPIDQFPPSLRHSPSRSALAHLSNSDCQIRRVRSAPVLPVSET